MNEQGQKILDEIVKAPGASVKEGNRFGGFDVIAPDGRGARFDPQGNFRGFFGALIMNSKDRLKNSNCE